MKYKVSTFCSFQHNFYCKKLTNEEKFLYLRQQGNLIIKTNLGSFCSKNLCYLMLKERKTRQHCNWFGTPTKYCKTTRWFIEYSTDEQNNIFTFFFPFPFSWPEISTTPIFLSTSSEKVLSLSVDQNSFPIAISANFVLGPGYYQTSEK